MSSTVWAYIRVSSENQAKRGREGQLSWRDVSRKESLTSDSW